MQSIQYNEEKLMDNGFNFTNLALPKKNLHNIFINQSFLSFELNLFAPIFVSLLFFH